MPVHPEAAPAAPAPSINPEPMPPELEQAAIQADAAKEEAFTKAAPTGDFTVEGLNALVDALNEVLPTFGAPGDYPIFSEEVDRLPSEFTKMLAMVSAAIEDAQLTDLAFSLEEITDDTDLVRVAGRLKRIAESPEFKRFLRAPADGGQPSAATPPSSVPPAPAPAPQMSPGQTDDLFASRV